ncbi:MAG: sel1 repeat family protein [Prevotella sp.]|nr:sel1 repeat family protein [Bacteroides sp.]MCM1366435.1 sel1 repeat family protein [Prevotella sp.]
MIHRDIAIKITLCCVMVFGFVAEYSSKAYAQDAVYSNEELERVYRKCVENLSKNGRDANNVKNTISELESICGKYSPAANLLGDIYRDGQYGIKSNIKNAMKYYELASQKGNSDSELSLGFIYISGESGITADKDKGLKYLKSSAEKGNSVAVSNLGYLYETGEYGIKPNLDEAVTWYKTGDKLNDADSEYALAKIYYSAKKGENNYSVAEKEIVELFEEASEHGSIEADCFLGLCYLGELEPALCKNDKIKAKKHIDKAVAAGDDEGYYVMGVYVETAENDKATAIEWYKKSAEMGNKNAKERLGLNKQIKFQGIGFINHDNRIPQDQTNRLKESMDYLEQIIQVSKDVLD